MFSILQQLNWLAIALASLAYYVLGAAWFTPLFGKAWDRSIGYNREKGPRFGLDYYFVPLASSVLVSIALGILLALSDTTNLGDAVLVGLIVGLGIALPISINNALTPNTPRPYLLGAVTAGYHVIGVTTASAIIGAFSS